MCVLTQTEGEGLLPMCSGLMERYRRAGEPPPQILYVGQDCCSTTGKSKMEAMFHEWDQLVVRLDAWQFMQRFTAGVTSESHPLYGPFMGRLFSCIFEWDAGDLKALQEAKQHELRQSKDAKGIGKLTAKELLRHCRHQTREAQVTKQLIEQLLKDFMGATDFMGNKLVDQETMEEIWRAQQCHLLCIQDPPGVQLYRKVREVTRGGLFLPLYHCARGVGSLESFHQHLKHFIPGLHISQIMCYFFELSQLWFKCFLTALFLFFFRYKYKWPVLPCLSDRRGSTVEQGPISCCRWRRSAAAICKPSEPEVSRLQTGWESQ